MVNGNYEVCDKLTESKWERAWQADKSKYYTTAGNSQVFQWQEF